MDVQAGDKDAGGGCEGHGKAAKGVGLLQLEEGDGVQTVTISVTMLSSAQHGQEGVVAGL